MIKLIKIVEALFLYGLELKDITEPFEIGELDTGKLIVYPEYDIRGYLNGFDPDRVQQIIDSGVIFAELKARAKGYEKYLFDYPITALRLFKSGWIKEETIIPEQNLYLEIRMEFGEQPIAQNWAKPMCYELRRAEIPYIIELNQKLQAIPKGYLEVALRRFNRSYEYLLYPNLDDCLIDLVIALESLISGGGDSIMQSMALRISLLLGDKLKDRKRLVKKVKRFYKHRSDILHGGETTAKEFKERFETLEDLRSLVRDIINRSIDILNSQKTKSGKLAKNMTEVIDGYLYDSLHK